MSIIYTLSEKQYNDHPEGSVIARQGDVVLFKPFRLATPGDLIEEGDKNRIVLAHGEVTGHAHAFYFSESAFSEPEKVFRLFSCDASSCCKTTLPGQFLRLSERSFLRHEEHYAFSLPPVDYISVIQHQGDELHELRRIAD